MESKSAWLTLQVSGSPLALTGLHASLVSKLVARTYKSPKSPEILFRRQTSLASKLVTMTYKSYKSPEIPFRRQASLVSDFVAMTHISSKSPDLPFRGQSLAISLCHKSCTAINHPSVQGRGVYLNHLVSSFCPSFLHLHNTSAKYLVIALLCFYAVYWRFLTGTGGLVGGSWRRRWGASQGLSVDEPA
jgi:hypothetical protein